MFYLAYCINCFFSDCPENCETCSSTTVCTTCKSGYTWVTDTCKGNVSIKQGSYGAGKSGKSRGF